MTECRRLVRPHHETLPTQRPPTGDLPIGKTEGLPHTEAEVELSETGQRKTENGGMLVLDDANMKVNLSVLRSTAYKPS